MCLWMNYRWLLFYSTNWGEDIHLMIYSYSSCIGRVLIGEWPLIETQRGSSVCPLTEVTQYTKWSPTDSIALYRIRGCTLGRECIIIGYNVQYCTQNVKYFTLLCEILYTVSRYIIVTLWEYDLQQKYKLSLVDVLL